MGEFDIYNDIKKRTNGDIYFGVVGPVRAGKSTFIANFMQKMVLPNVQNNAEKQRMLDELPQSANGKVIMTTQPKFVPSEAVQVNLADDISAKIRLVDCVGYLVDGASGATENGLARMVKTPWSEKDMPFSEAADIGTKKVITEHSTIGIVVTTDGSIATELPRSSYVDAEERVVNELKEIGKPFIIVLNSAVPHSDETVKLANALSEKYQSTVIPLDVQNLSQEDIMSLFKGLLLEFPLKRVDFELSKWLKALPKDNSLIQSLISDITLSAEKLQKMRDFANFAETFNRNDNFQPLKVTSVSLGDGSVCYEVNASDGLFYKALSEECDMDIQDDCALMSHIKSMSFAKKQYDRMAVALQQVEQSGYGVVSPTMDDMSLEEPQIVKQGNKFGVKLKASAPSYHIMKVDIEAEVSPIVGTEQQSEELVKYLLDEFEADPKGIWQTNMFGKSLHSLVNEGLYNKINAMPADTQKKMRRALSRIINEGKGGIICILL